MCVCVCVCVFLTFSVAFRFEDEYPTPPQYQGGLTGRGGVIAITGTSSDIVSITSAAEW